MAEHVCPVWAGYFLLSPLRKLMQNPQKILSTYVREGMTVLDYGSAMGFFSIPLAEMVGTVGKVICVDIQEKMLRALKKRARKAGVADRIETRQCNLPASCLQGLAEKIDFALAFAVVHEVPDPSALFTALFTGMKPLGKVLVAEPSNRVSEGDFAITVRKAEEQGFTVTETPRVPRCRAVLLVKKE
jgi:2-polyprenyl-3-methyl-5-hydroxy-6-metoxy-1,4-benzoquinol methylase